MKQILSIFLTLTLFLLQSGCASIVSGRNQDISVRSNPPGASVEIDGMPMGKTPVTTEVKRKKRHQIKIEKQGYLEETRTTKKGFNWWFAGNVIFGGIIGIIIDFATGAVYSVSPDEVNVSLIQSEGSLKASDAPEKVEIPAAPAKTVAADDHPAQIEKSSEMKK